MIEFILSLAGLAVIALIGIIMLLGSLLTGSLTFLSVLIAAPFLIAVSIFAVGPALGVRALTTLLEEHPELVALGALILGIAFGLYYMLRNGNNRNNNGNGINGFRINGNGLNNGKRNGINGKNVNGYKEIKRNGVSNGKSSNGKNGFHGNGKTNK